MLFERFYTPGIAQVAYAVADPQAGVAAIIDPRRDVDPYVRWAAANGVRIAAALETHIHADFVSGASELRAATGAAVYASSLGGPAFEHRRMADGDEEEIGALRLRALATPGHTPEHLAFLMLDPASGGEPTMLFSGDALFVGEVGRPDLLGREATEGLASQLYRTVRRLAALPDALVVYPGHTAGSACGRTIRDAPHTTIGGEKRSSYAFQASRQSEKEFKARVLEGMPAPPTYYPVLKSLNRRGAPLLARLPSGGALPPARVARLLAEGALLVDARAPEEFGEGHVPGAVSVGLGPSFSTWMGWLAPYDRDLVLVLADDERYAEARTELRRIGLDRLSGYAAGGMAAWRAEGRPEEGLTQLSVRELGEGLAAGRLTVLDVRARSEWDTGHIPEALHMPGGPIVGGEGLAASVGGPVAVVCGSGYRSSVVASVLRARGREGLSNVVGGMAAWEAAGLPTTHNGAGM